jgi:hypothetical protein
MSLEDKKRSCAGKSVASANEAGLMLDSNAHASQNGRARIPFTGISTCAITLLPLRSTQYHGLGSSSTAAPQPGSRER